MADTLNIVLRNETPAAQLYAHITGSDDKGIVIMSADGKTPYRPTSPSDTLQPLGADCAIPLGGTGGSRTVAIPRISGGRIWFCKDKPLSFFVNPGPALFTWNAQELYANVSFVDFVGLPVSLQLKTGDGQVKTVPGMPADGLEQVCGKLEAQGKADGKGWEKLVVRDAGGAPLRALSPNAGAVLVPGLFDGYYQSYVDAVWDKYTKEDLTVNTQFKWGDVTGRTSPDGKLLTFASSDGSSSITFGKPSAADIFTCSTGPFAHGAGVSEEQLNVGARLAAALNRSTLLANARQPEGEKVEGYYKEATTNHYARGYAFPYDDVGASGGTDQSGFVNDPNPKELTVCVGKPL
ncbi:hypothetical protein ACCO45_002328 [Purpureocillium lilacinum]|uniref:Uncharacterized protein n=1 Tax=Purpureocillium lilacinum TaxID=33203 RepID=A0ACC4EBV7_PURLI